MALSTPSSLQTASSTVSESSLTTGSFTPSNNSVLVVCCSGITVDTWDGTDTVTLSDSETLTWTDGATGALPNSYYYSIAYIGYAEVGTGTSMTVTATYSNDIDNPRIEVLELTGYDTSAPIGANAGEWSGGSPDGTSPYSATTASTSCCIGMCVTDDGSYDAEDIDTGTGWTQISEAGVSQTGTQIQYYVGTKSDVEYDEIQAAFSWAIAGVEVQEASAGGGGPRNGRRNIDFNAGI